MSPQIHKTKHELQVKICKQTTIGEIFTTLLLITEGRNKHKK